MKKLYISDIDETITRNNEKPSNYFLSELKTLINNGIHFALNTARAYDNVMERFGNINSTIITRSGALIYDSSGKIIKKNVITNSKKVIKKLLRQNLHFVICTVKNKKEIYYSNSKINNSITNNFSINIVKSNYLLSIKSIISIYVFDKLENDNKIDNKTLIRNYGDFYQITSDSCTKLSAVLWLKRKYKFDYVVSFGDDENDYDLLDKSNDAYLVTTNSNIEDKKYRYINFDYGKTIIEIMKKKKILMIPSGYYPECNGGVEVITQALSEGLVKKGYEIVVMCQSNRNKDEYINDVHVYRVKPHEITNKNNSIFIYKINRLLQMYNPFNKKVIKEIILKENPNIVHVHMVRTLSMSVFSVVNKLNIPIVSTLHEYFSLWNFDPFGQMKDMLVSKPQWYVQLLREKHKKLTKNTKIITAPLMKTINEYQKEGYYKNVPGIEILNALPTLEDKKRKEILNTKINKHTKNASNINFLIISRLMPFKGIEEAVHAFMNLDADNITLNIAGDGELKNYIRDCAIKDNRIKFWGYVCGEEKEKLFKENDVLIFPTTELETYGLVIIEAYNYSMPVIASNVEATKRLVKNGLTGTILNEVNEQELCKAMKKYNNKKQLLKEIKQCYESISEEDYNKFINDYINIYERIDNES